MLLARLQSHTVDDILTVRPGLKVWSGVSMFTVLRCFKTGRALLLGSFHCKGGASLVDFFESDL